MPLMQITERRVGPVTVLTLSGHLILGDGDLLLKERVDSLVGEGCLDIILNLHDVDFIDSCGLGVVVSRYVSLKKKGGELKVLCPSDRCRRVFGIAGLLNIFQPCESEDDAIRGLLARYTVGTR